MDRQCGDTWTFFGLVKTRTPYRCDIRLRYSAYYIRCGYWCAPYQRRAYSSIDTHLPRLCLPELSRTGWNRKLSTLLPHHPHPFHVHDTLLDVCPTTGTFRTESLATIGTAQTLQQQLGRCLFHYFGTQFRLWPQRRCFWDLGKPDSFTGSRQASGWVISNRGLFLRTGRTASRNGRRWVLFTFEKGIRIPFA